MLPTVRLAKSTNHCPEVLAAVLLNLGEEAKPQRQSCGREAEGEKIAHSGEAPNVKEYP